jgi:uncharacterized membrane protein
MSSTLAPGPWPAPASGALPWWFAREIQSADAGGARAVQWRMVRNGSFVPGRLLYVYLALCVLALGVGTGFWWLGAPAVLPLAGIELLLLGSAFWLASRHAGDAETLTLAERELTVQHRCGRQTEQAAFRAEWVRVEPVHGEGSLLELSGQGQRIRVGRYLRPELRSALARELRLALKRECTRAAAQDNAWETQR